MIDWLWMPGSPGRTHRIRWCATCVVSYNVRVEGTSTLRGMRATRGTPPNVDEQRNYSLFLSAGYGDRTPTAGVSGECMGGQTGQNLEIRP